MVSPQIRVDVALFTRGGESILRLIGRQQYDTLQTRPRLSRGRKTLLMLGAMTARAIRFVPSSRHEEQERA